MKLIGATLDDDGHLRPCPSVLGSRVGVLQFELLNGVDRDAQAGLAADLIPVRRSIDEEAVAVRPVAVGREVAEPGVGNVLVGAGGQVDEVENVPSVERKVEDLPGFDHAFPGRAVTLHLRRDGFDDDGAVDGSQGQLRVHPDPGNRGRPGNRSRTSVGSRGPRW